MPRDLRDPLHDLLESYIRSLPLDEKIEFLARLAATGQFDSTTRIGSSEHSFAYNQPLAKLVPDVASRDIQVVVQQLISEFVKHEIDRRVEERETARSFPRDVAVRVRREKRTNINSRGPFKVVFEDDGLQLTTSDLGSFLTLFGRVYEHAVDLQLAPPEFADYPGLIDEHSPGTREESLNALKLRLETDAESHSSTAQLVVARIRKSSPLTIWFDAVGSALALAVIISGGTIKVPGMTFKLNPIGDGLKKLRAAMTAPVHKRIIPEKPPERRIKLR